MPVGFLDDVIVARRYVDSYYANQADPKGFSKTPMRRLVQAIEMELVQEGLNKNTHG